MMLTNDGTTTQKPKKMADILHNSLKLNWKKSVINLDQPRMTMYKY